MSAETGDVLVSDGGFLLVAFAVLLLARRSIVSAFRSTLRTFKNTPKNVARILIGVRRTFVGAVTSIPVHPGLRIAYQILRIALNKRNADPRRRLGQELLDLGRPWLANLVLNSADRLDPNELETQLLLARSWKMLGKPYMAIAGYRQAMRLNPRDPRAQAELAKAIICARIFGRGPEVWILEDLLDWANIEELKHLCHILELRCDLDDKKTRLLIAKDISRRGGHWLGNLMLGDDRVPYSEVVWDVCQALDVPAKWESQVAQNERLLIKTVCVQIERELNEEDLKRLQKQIEVEMGASPGALAAEASGLAALAGAQASGFGVYLAATTALGAASQAVGVTLPFSVYTGVTSTICSVIGPLGWIALAACMAYSLRKLGGPETDKLLPVVLLVARVRNDAISLVSSLESGTNVH